MGQWKIGFRDENFLTFHENSRTFGPLALLRGDRSCFSHRKPRKKKSCVNDEYYKMLHFERVFLFSVSGSGGLSDISNQACLLAWFRAFCVPESSDESYPPNLEVSGYKLPLLAVSVQREGEPNPATHCPYGNHASRTNVDWGPFISVLDSVSKTPEGRNAGSKQL